MMLRTTFKWMSVSLMLMTLLSAKASEPYVVEGFIDDVKFTRMQTDLLAMAEGQTIEFRQCFGWQQRNLKQFQQIVALLSKKGLNTVAKGLCTRECAALFLLGSGKSLRPAEEGKSTAVIFHPLINDDNEFLKSETTQLLSLISANSKGKIPPEVFRRLFDVEDEIGGIAIYRDSKAPDTSVFFSASRKHRPVPVSGYTLEKLGIAKE